VRAAIVGPKVSGMKERGRRRQEDTAKRNSRGGPAKGGHRKIS